MLRRQPWACLSHANEADLRVAASQPQEVRSLVVLEREEKALPLYVSTLTEGG